MVVEELQNNVEVLENLIKHFDYITAKTHALTLLEALPAGDALDEAHSGLRCRTLLALSASLRQGGMAAEALTYAKEALALAEQYHNHDLTAKAYGNIGNLHAQLSDYTSALECFSQAVVFYEKYGNTTGVAKAMYGIGTAYELHADSPRALEYYTKALEAFELLDMQSERAKCIGAMANVFSNQADYPKALEYYAKALALHEELGSKEGAARIIGHTAIVYWNLADYSTALEWNRKALAIHEELDMKADIASITGNIGIIYLDCNDYTQAVEYFAKALALYQALGMDVSMSRIHGSLGNLYYKMADYPKALDYFHAALAVQEKHGIKLSIAITTGNIGNVYNTTGNYTKASEYYTKAVELNEELGAIDGIACVYGNLGILYSSQADYDKAMEYYQRALHLHETLGMKADVALVMSTIGTLYAREEFSGHNSAEAEKYLLTAIMMNTELGVRQNLYESHKALAELYEKQNRWEEFAVHFKKYHHLEKEVQSQESKKQAELFDFHRKQAEREKNHAVERAKHQATEQLLHNVLPPSIANKMLGGTKLIAEKIPSVSVLFADIVNFTKLSQRITPEELVEGLDRIFSEFDALAEKYDLEKIKTIGDAYMVVAGAPVQREDHAEAIAHFAFEMMETMKQFRSIATGEEVQIRIGIHSGEVVAGVIGKKKFAYDLWGDAVNTASRMESHGEAGKIHVSEEFKHAVETQNIASLQFIERGEMAIKGKGIMKTYFLEKTTPR
ncbi:MAG: adenylate/guanylate cyclase domain-containing protein [Candidatus Kapaibacterium sp.]